MAEQGMLPKFGTPASQTSPGARQKPVASATAESRDLPKQIEFKVAEVNQRRAGERVTTSRTQDALPVATAKSSASPSGGTIETGSLISAGIDSPARAVSSVVKGGQPTAGCKSVFTGSAAENARAVRDPEARKDSRLSRVLFGSWLKSRNDPFKPADQLRSASGHQPELSLDKVRVVRNDLADSDFEILTSDSVHRKGGRSAAPIHSDKSLNSGTSGLAARLFNAVRVRV
jgi:hypothetical protein